MDTALLALLRTTPEFADITRAIRRAKAQDDRELVQVLLMEVAMLALAEVARRTVPGALDGIERATALAAAATAAFRNTRTEGEAARRFGEAMAIFGAMFGAPPASEPMWTVVKRFTDGQALLTDEAAEKGPTSRLN